MKNTDVRQPVLILLFVISIVAVAASACTRGAENTNLTANTNTNVNANATGANVNAANAPSTIAAREPETYKGTIVFTAQTEGGDQAIGIPKLSS